jgi:hypothetical protein
MNKIKRQQGRVKQLGGGRREEKRRRIILIKNYHIEKDDHPNLY